MKTRAQMCSASPNGIIARDTFSPADAGGPGAPASPLDLVELTTARRGDYTDPHPGPLPSDGRGSVWTMEERGEQFLVLLGEECWGVLHCRHVAEQMVALLNAGGKRRAA